MIRTKSYRLAIVFIVLFLWTSKVNAQNDSTLVAPIEVDTMFVKPVLDSAVTDSIDVDEAKSFENSNVNMFFKTDSVSMIKNEIVSNVLTVVNVSGSQLKFKVNQVYPAAWELIAIFDGIKTTGMKRVSFASN